MANISRSFDPPFRDMIMDRSGLMSDAWSWFMRSVFERLYPHGEEKTFTLVNNQSSAADITGLKFNARGVTCVFLEYLVQRVTTGGSAVELTEAGLMIFTYNPTSESWTASVGIENKPDNAGIVFSITSAGQVQYTTTNAAGTPLISSLFYRARTLAGRIPTTRSRELDDGDV